MKQTLIISAGTLTNDGYQSRIEMEMELLRDYFDFVIVTSIQSKGVSVRVPCDIVYYDVNIHKYKIMNFCSNRKLFRKCLSDVLKKYKNPIVYCESLMPLLRSLRISKKQSVPCVYDCHGIQPVEYRLYHPNLKGWLYSQYLSLKEKRYVKQCNLIITVTDKQYAIWNCNTKYCKLPMIPGEEFLRNPLSNKEEVREKLGIPIDSIVFVYSGGTNKWQMCSETMKIYSEIEKSIPNSYMLVLSHDIITFQKLSEEYDIRKIKILSAEYHEMPYYLSACDYGFCIREDNIINNVASPTKLLEYLARNITPIMSNKIGEYSELFRDNKLAIIVDDYQCFHFGKCSMKSGVEFVHKYKEDVVKNYIQSVTSIK